MLGFTCRLVCRPEKRLGKFFHGFELRLPERCEFLLGFQVAVKLADQLEARPVVIECLPSLWLSSRLIAKRLRKQSQLFVR